jgi:hypothetical protein
MPNLNKLGEFTICAVGETFIGSKLRFRAAGKKNKLPEKIL